MGSPTRWSIKHISLSPSSRWERDQDNSPLSRKPFGKATADCICTEPEPFKSQQVLFRLQLSHVPVPSDGESMRWELWNLLSLLSTWPHHIQMGIRSYLFRLTMAAHHYPGKGWDAVSTSILQPSLRALQTQGAISSQFERLLSRYPPKWAHPAQFWFRFA